MTDDAPAIFVALEQSGFGAAIRQSTWIYPAANIGHIVALVVFAGSIAMMDVRLLGASRPPCRDDCSPAPALSSSWRSSAC